MILPALFLSLAVGLLAFFLIRYFGPKGELEKQKSIRHRIVQSASPSTGNFSSDLLKKRDNLSELDVLKKLLTQYAPSKEIALNLRTIKLKMSVSVFMMVCILIFIFSFSALKIVIYPVLALVLSLILGAAPLYALKILHKKYLAKFSEYLPNALSIISSSIKVGHGLDSAIEAVANTAPYPVNNEFRTVIAEIKLGISLPVALENLYDRVRSEELKIFVTGISIHQDLGGNLSEILDNLEKTIRERFALLREIDTLSSQGKFSSWVLFIIPFALVGIYMWKSQAIFFEFVHSGFGQTIIWVCLGLQIFGFIGIRQVVKLRD